MRRAARRSEAERQPRGNDTPSGTAQEREAAAGASGARGARLLQQPLLVAVALARRRPRGEQVRLAGSQQRRRRARLISAQAAPAGGQRRRRSVRAGGLLGHGDHTRFGAEAAR
jgi:hypothetical protein